MKVARYATAQKLLHNERIYLAGDGNELYDDTSQLEFNTRGGNYTLTTIDQLQNY